MVNEEIIKEVEERVKKELEGKYDPGMFGYIHILESRMKEILKNDYGINFETSREKDDSFTID